MPSEIAWLWVIGAVGLYCVIQAIRDFRARHYLWAGVAAICAAALLLTPMRTHAVKLDLVPGQPHR